ncbi:diguanylate cyclase [Desulfobacter postgatei]|uniref:diguanylate cyclase n=1 Tax=Desulfobacter postgatei TaxID=2293 RepID=UPI00259B4128|nr:diguanylate cyclase [uncultured Desulfobacter sp.]
MASDKKKQTILIVDDERANLIVLNDLLKAEYHVLPAKSGTQALERIKTESPDLILLDVNMPEMDGYEVCRQLKSQERTRNIPIVFVTTLDSLENEEKGLLLGALDYISKPFHPPIVKARVKNILTFVLHKKLLEEMANLDGLTKIPNRRSFEEALTVEWNRCMRTCDPFSLAMLDVDFFKLFNDTYGHNAGDDALRAVGAILFENAKRSCDTVARYGGEEFVLLLPGTDAEGALTLTDKIRLSIKKLRIPHSHSSVCKYMTVSAGGATQIPKAGRSPIDLLKCADNMLYKAKKQGRNIVVWHSSTDEAAKD